jgi:ABC-type lipoprotein release transport system permease subunit
MAMGTIPVVAPYVDMEKYHNPPKEGIHYIRLNSYDSEEAKTLLDTITEEKGEQMSRAAHEWWKKNASAEGLFELTQKLVL